jgi:hypothetical protein
MLRVTICCSHVLRHSEWSCVLNVNSFGSAVNNLTAIAREAINLAIPYVKSKHSTFLHYFSNYLKYYIKKKSEHFRRYKKSKSDHNYSVFSYCRKQVKTIIKRGKLRRMPSSGMWSRVDLV